MVKCECGRVWYYDDVTYEWKIEKGQINPTVVGISDIFEPIATKMSGGAPDYEATELVVYQCPCGKINGAVAMNLDKGIDTLGHEYWGIFLHPDWDNEDIDADI